ncbi:heme ABC transporter permease CcmC [Rickettsia endosymbiont of Cardiosporidium cionae]|uniref:heme ABC transporter permease CcmC n=1 Tax=Rickettsia endosymbiont of Cardiosporidium cionae TaxID=2777155 RepID=UPI0018941E89|nr:heme ABC transporter permease CcmC [Rickettsia endosymbiont of Cardiosporidium cionae]KAF8818259.1 heme exporter protein C [Rickettsia endosymbiont of Cardiosporidium cionae]
MNIFSILLFNKIAKKLLPILAILTPIVNIVALYYALVISPPDYQQGELVRIMYIHVPSAWISLMIYSFIAFCSILVLIRKIKIAYLLAVASSYIGTVFSAITLVTGSLWGRPIWGVWWVWDSRLTSMLILFFIYISYIIVVHTNSNIVRSEKPASVLAILGFINVPIVKFSVDIWNSLHQPSTIFRSGGVAIHNTMLIPLILMAVSFLLLFLLLLMYKTYSLILEARISNKLQYDICGNGCMREM